MKIKLNFWCRFYNYVQSAILYSAGFEICARCRRSHDRQHFIKQICTIFIAANLMQTTWEHEITIKSLLHEGAGFYTKEKITPNES